MPVEIRGNDIPLLPEEVQRLWQQTIEEQQSPDELVVVGSVTVEEIRRLNKKYRGKDQPTNVLVFSFPAQSEFSPVADDKVEQSEHNIVLCLPQARAEAEEKHVELGQYAALLLVHAFLHVTGMDHEHSEEEAAAMRQREQDILSKSGFTGQQL